MANNEKKFETTGLFPTKFYQRNYWASNKFCQLSCFKANNGYECDECCKNQNPVPCNMITNEETSWMVNNKKKCESTGLIVKFFHQSNYWANNNFCQLSFFKANS